MREEGRWAYLGSRYMFMFGAQQSWNAGTPGVFSTPALLRARDSVEMASPIACKSAGLKEAPNPIG